MRIGYVRNQEVAEMEKQANIILKHPIDELVLDRTGEKLPELLDRLRYGDVLNIATLDRLSRDLQKTNAILERLSLIGVRLYVDGEQFIFSETLSPEAKVFRAIRDTWIANYGVSFLNLTHREQSELIADTIRNHFHKDKTDK